ncbi:XRE family transcriptional regulator [Marinilabiliaceae bacterium JC017]|nr:XRE family transcriptional regulator [Marinilabiliaceae bacterium JC017]
MSIGKKINKLRSLKNISHIDLSERTNLSEEQINLIESDETHPSLGVLVRIARVLGVRLGTFLDDQDKLGPCIMRAGSAGKSISLSNDKEQSREHLNFYSLAPDKVDRSMEPFIINVLPTHDGAVDLSSHEGEEFLFVLHGMVELTYGNEKIQLNQGDSIYIDSIIEHHLHANGEEAAKVLAVVYVPV